VEFLGVLHAVAVRDCPFDRRLEVTVGLAAANVTAGLVDEQDFDEVCRGRSAGRLLDQLLADLNRAEGLAQADLAVCHDDCCLPMRCSTPESYSKVGSK
jgi:aminoglycoside phosphotransferase